MLFFVGVAIVIGGVLGGFVMEGGAVMALWQPLELLIIGGAALGAMIIGTPMPIIKAMIGQIKGAILAGGLAKKDYLDVLAREWELYAQQPALADRLFYFWRHIVYPVAPPGNPVLL